MPQFLIEPTQIEGETIRVIGHDAKHLVKVLRYQKGHHLYLSDGHYQYRGIITDIGFKEVVLKILDKMEWQEKATPPSLAIALLKHDHLEMVLQKGVELGIRHFHLFVSERTIPHYEETATPKKMERFHKILIEAAKQSGMQSPPTITAPVSWNALVEKLNTFSGTLLCWEEEDEKNDFDTAFRGLDTSNLLLLIGPEGGLTEAEVAKAVKAGAKKARLGRQILRAETAAIAIATLCQHALGNL